MRPSFSQATNLSNPKLHIHRLIFAGKNGITPINYRKKWTSLTSMLCRPELRIHDVRHWVAASLLRSGVGVGVASQIMGHRDQTMLLRRYGHLDSCSLQSAQEVRWKISDTLLSPIWSRSEEMSGWKFHTHLFVQLKTPYTFRAWILKSTPFPSAQKVSSVKSLYAWTYKSTNFWN